MNDKFKFNSPELQKAFEKHSPQIVANLEKLDLINKDIKRLEEAVSRFPSNRGIFKASEDLYLMYNGDRLCCSLDKDESPTRPLLEHKAVTRLKAYDFLPAYFHFAMKGE